jgi:transcriptional regulator with XRE-family HTH domain
MTLRWNPVVAHRRLRAELRRLRDQAGLTQREVASALDWSPSKVIRIETGAVGISSTDLWALLRHYGVTEEERVAEFDALAKASKGHAWWNEYRQYFSQQFINFIATESSSSFIRVFESLAIPGLLQTENYARAIAQTLSKPERIEPSVQVRMARQRLFDQEDRPAMFFIMDEAALRRQVGGSTVMREQLFRFKELNQLSGVSIQVIEFDYGAHSGMQGSFGVYEFPADNGADQVVYLENLYRNVLLQNDPEEISRYLETFYALEGIASPKDKLDEVIDRILGS